MSVLAIVAAVARPLRHRSRVDGRTGAQLPGSRSRRGKSFTSLPRRVPRSRVSRFSTACRPWSRWHTWATLGPSCCPPKGDAASDTNSGPQRHPSAREAGYQKLVIQIGVMNTLAQAFYRGFGFRECGRLTRQVVIDGIEDDEVLMELFV